MVALNKIRTFCSVFLIKIIMQKEVFMTLIKEGQDEIEGLELYQRHFEFEEQGRYVLVGIHQAGKSYQTSR